MTAFSPYDPRKKMTATLFPFSPASFLTYLENWDTMTVEQDTLATNSLRDLMKSPENQRQ